ncbi:hypothetical protein J4G43_034090 [Bradyrhizobium barranii subsp. barranii]|uniref:Uncharacterized protein n=1 Tax=Bradyrhizobium barranii subsp. barranii TaxID=2823807 RepID=A0A9X9YD67_9BRAD|nr:hypothetical protein [Bradyrhizobium barranii]UEM17861.1 hypothetical protein J4G43_034090 [Bradyrhizobium barranii subsp. barranii]
MRSEVSIRRIRPKRHSSTTAKIDSPVKIIQNSSALRSDGSAADPAIGPIVIELMLHCSWLAGIGLQRFHPD